MHVMSPGAPFTMEFPEPFHPGWGRVFGVAVAGAAVTIDPSQYFFRCENASWLVCDWAGVRDELVPACESGILTVEQLACDHVREHGTTIDDPAEVLRTAWDVNAWLYRFDVGVCGRMLREVGTLMALSRVETGGVISNVGPAWLLLDICSVVYGFGEVEVGLVEALYGAMWLDESRRVDAIKASAALGGRPLHACQSPAGMHGGSVVVPYGMDMAEFRRELGAFESDWTV
jgi:hypothetical protein